MSNKSVFKPQVLKASKNRNAFSLAHTNVFHAPYGALLPVATFKVPAGGYFEMDMENQTIMQPIVRPAFTLLKEHFDVFAVPMVQLHQAFDNFITGQNNYDNSAVAYPNSTGTATNNVPAEVPTFSGEMIGSSLYFAYNNAVDEFGINKAQGCCRILDLLGYGNFYKVLPLLDSGDVETANTATNMLVNNTLPQNFYNLLAYQKIYYSAYSNRKYETQKTYAFNIDDLNPMVYTDSTWDFASTPPAYRTCNKARFIEMCRMHYRWADKDYFTCVEPYVLPQSSNFGYTNLSSSATLGNVWQLFGIPGTPISSYNSQPAVTSQNTSGDNVQNNGQFVTVMNGTSNSYMNVAAIRFAFAYDRLLRRMRNAGPSFNLQMLAQFGIHPVDERHGEVKRLGGWTNALRLSEVTSTADLQGSDLGSIGGKMTSYSNNTKKIKYKAKEDCIIMVIYSTSIKNQYNSFRYKRENLCRYRFDWFNPAFENLGLQPVFTGEYDYIGGQVDATTNAPSYTRSTLAYQKAILGYSKRYMEYKTHPSEVHGLFAWPSNNVQMQAWVTQFRDLWYDANDNLVTIGQTAFAQPTLECSPFTLNSILQTAQDGSWESDAFFVFCYFNAKLIANMSIDGEDF